MRAVLGRLCSPDLLRSGLHAYIHDIIILATALGTGGFMACARSTCTCIVCLSRPGGRGHSACARPTSMCIILFSTCPVNRGPLASSWFTSIQIYHSSCLSLDTVAATGSLVARRSKLRLRSRRLHSMATWGCPRSVWPTCYLVRLVQSPLHIATLEDHCPWLHGGAHGLCGRHPGRRWHSCGSTRVVWP